MATRLDRQIEELGNIVEKRLNLCKATWNGLRCTLPANHETVEPHRFPIAFSADAKLAKNANNFAGGSGSVLNLK
jgi:hypothetical protein